MTPADRALLIAIADNVLEHPCQCDVPCDVYLRIGQALDAVKQQEAGREDREGVETMPRLS